MEHTTYQIFFYENHTLQNLSCPIDINLASQNVWWVQGVTNLKEGQPVSGNLVFDSNTNTYSLTK